MVAKSHLRVAVGPNFRADGLREEWERVYEELNPDYKKDAHGRYLKDNRGPYKTIDLAKVREVVAPFLGIEDIPDNKDLLANPALLRDWIDIMSARVIRNELDSICLTNLESVQKTQQKLIDKKLPLTTPDQGKGKKRSTKRKKRASTAKSPAKRKRKATTPVDEDDGVNLADIEAAAEVEDREEEETQAAAASSSRTAGQGDDDESAITDDEDGDGEDDDGDAEDAANVSSRLVGRD